MRTGATAESRSPACLLRPPLYDMALSAIVGDRRRDIESGRAARVGVTILVDYGYGEEIRHEPPARVGPFGRPRTGSCRPRAIDRAARETNEP